MQVLRVCLNLLDKKASCNYITVTYECEQIAHLQSNVDYSYET